MNTNDTEKIETREQLADFIKRIAEDYSVNGQSWENSDLPRYLDALQRWLRDSDGLYRNLGMDKDSISPWRWLAHGFSAARIYE
ncbi:DUF7660 family protein [Roseimicrobium gellanilyticum]|uniref:DUF7660 family protein n=1 Tax=Roseimicrobium gellanilyticum TaxID=748857 RepID=UPI000DE8E830